MKRKRFSSLIEKNNDFIVRWIQTIDDSGNLKGIEEFDIKNKEAIKQAKQKYNKNHIKTIKEKSRIYHSIHKEERNKKSLNYYYQHRDDILEQNKKSKIGLPETEIIKRYTEFWSLSELSHCYQCNRMRIRKILVNAGIKIRNRKEAVKLAYYKNDEKSKNMQRGLREGQKKKMDTTIEIKIRNQLSEAKIKYLHPFDLKNKFLCDFFLPDFNLIIECDGDYWHSLEKVKEKDIRENRLAKEENYDMLRIPEHTIRNPLFNVLNSISSFGIEKL